MDDCRQMIFDKSDDAFIQTVVTNQLYQIFLKFHFKLICSLEYFLQALHEND